jgi:hypothetical protein
METAMIRLLATGLLVAFCLLIPLAAPLPGAGVADAREPAGAFSKGITRLELAKVLAGHGMSVRDATLDEKDPWLKARTPKGVEFYVNMYQCTGTGPARRRCSNLQFLAQWERTKRTTLEAANTYNQRFVFGRAYLSQDGKTFMFDYSVNLQDGITAGNLRKHVDNWLRVLDDVRSLLKV